jgi:hypothetical protein
MGFSECSDTGRDMCDMVLYWCLELRPGALNAPFGVGGEVKSYKLPLLVLGVCGVWRRLKIYCLFLKRSYPFLQLRICKDLL